MSETVGYSFFVNLSEKNVKIDVTEDEQYIRDCYVWEDDKSIKVIKGDQTIFEVTSRSKAFKEILPYVRRKVVYVVIRKRQGDYGIYYRTRLKFEMTREELGMT